MLVTQQPVLKRFWYVTVPMDYLEEGPQPFILLGENIVIWKGLDGQPAAASDRCCHRTAKLSKGYVEDGNIICGYHGWTYDQSGRCVCIPQLAEGRAIPETARVQSYHCQEKYGYAWVALEEPLQGIPDIPEENLQGIRRIHCFYETWKTSGLRFMENAFDNSHFSFVHRNTFGDFDNPQPSKYEIQHYDWGFQSHTEVPIKNPPSSHKLTGTADPETLRILDNTYYLPFSRRFGCSYPNGLIHTIFNCATPIDDERIMLSQWLYRNDTEDQAPCADLIAFDRAVTDEDKDILESTDPDACVDVSRRVEQHMESDRPGLMIRRMLLELLREHGEEEVHR